MNPTIITARISDQRLQLVNEALIASGGVDVVQICFEFCGLWDGCGKTAVFYRNPEEVYHVPIVDGLATVPWEVLTEAGFFYFGVFGTANNVRPTEVIKVKVEQGAITTATAEPQEPTPNIYEQLIAAYGHMEQEMSFVNSRLDQAITMRSDGGIASHSWSVPNGYGYMQSFEGSVKSNGADAWIEFTFKASDTMKPGGAWNYFLPKEYQPLLTTEIPFYGAQGSYISATVSADGEDTLITITNISEANLGTSTYWQAKGFYPLASVSVSELADVRVGVDGTTYETAGAAVRQQGQDLLGLGRHVDTLQADHDALAMQVHYLDAREADPVHLGQVKVARDGSDAENVGIIFNWDKPIQTVAATNEQIDARENEHCPIVPANLERAVKSVGDGYYAKVGEGAAKTYEKIATVTVKADADGKLPKHIIFSKDSNGEAFQLESFYVKALIGATDGSSARLTLTMNDIATVFGGASLGSVLSTTPKGWAMYYKDLGENEGALCIAQALANGSDYPTQPNINNASFTGGVILPYMTQFKPVKMLDFWFNGGSAATFAAGTKMELWGVRK